MVAAKADIDRGERSRFAQGRTDEVFALDDDRVIKVARIDAGELLEREAASAAAMRRTYIEGGAEMQRRTIEDGG